MSEIEELRLRVEAAEEHFGLIADQQEGYSQRLVTLLNIAGQKDQTIEKLERENEQLRTMLFSLLQAIEKGDTTNTLHDMDVRLSAMTSEPIEIADKTTKSHLPPPSPVEEVTPPEEEETLSNHSPGTGSPDSSIVGQNDQVDSPIDVNDLEAASDIETTAERPDIIAESVNTSGQDQEFPPEEVSGSDDLSDLELSDSQIPNESEDAIIAEIAENLEQVLPSEDVQEELSNEEMVPDNPVDEVQGTKVDEVQGTKTDKNVSAGKSQDATLEDAILALSKISEEDPIDSSDPPPVNEEEDEAVLDLDSFLGKNGDEDINTPPSPEPASPEPENPESASPEIEDIMERISKQALSHND